MKSLNNRDYALMLKIMERVRDGTILDRSITSINLRREARNIIKRQDRMILLTKKQKELLALRAAIRKEYDALMTEGSASTEVVRHIAEKHGISTVTVYAHLRKTQKEA